MSYDPVLSNAKLLIDGDINSDSGMFGIAAAISTNDANPILHVPPTYFSKYYNKYVVDISDTVLIGDFILAEIGTDVIIGHSLTIECIASIPNTNILRVFASDNTIKALLVPGDKIFLQAIGPTSNWNVSYTVPLGLNNRLIVYNGVYPRVDTLPIQKELVFNMNFEYGIKSIASYDTNEPSTFILPTTDTNLHRIVVEGSQNLQINEFDPFVTSTGDYIISALSTRDCTFQLDNGAPSIATIIASTSCNYEQLKFTENTIIAACENSYIDSTRASNLEMYKNLSLLASSNSAIIGGVGLFPQNISIDSSNNVICNGSVYSNISSSENSFIFGTVGSTMNSCSNCNLFGDGIRTTTSGATNNSLGNTTVLSSHNIVVSGNALLNRYLVLGGFDNVTWSIDSKTGIHYGSGFNNTQPLPGFSELYENSTAIIYELGRLIKLVAGSVTYCNDGDIGEMIVRPHEGAAFLGGNPFEWPLKYECDVFGRKTLETVPISQVLQEIDSNPNYTSEQKQILKNQYNGMQTLTRPKLNPNYNPALNYIPRVERLTEWTICEKMGRVVVEHNGSLTLPGQYIISANEGVAKLSLNKSNIRVLRVISSKYAEVDLMPYNQY